MRKDGPTAAGLGRAQKELRELWTPQGRLPTHDSVSEAQVGWERPTFLKTHPARLEALKNEWIWWECQTVNVPGELFHNKVEKKKKTKTLALGPQLARLMWAWGRVVPSPMASCSPAG